MKLKIHGGIWTLLKHRKSAKLPWRHNIKLSFWSLSFCHFVISSFVAVFVVVVFVVLVFFLHFFKKTFFFNFVQFFSSSFLPTFYSEQMSEGSEVSKVTLCVKFLKWHPLTDSVGHSLTKVRYRAARAAKHVSHRRHLSNVNCSCATSWNIHVFHTFIKCQPLI